MGLGTAAGPDAVSLKDARSSAAEARKLLDAGIDPIVMRGKKLEEAKADLEKPTFEEFAKHFIDTKATGCETRNTSINGA